ncbi:dihydrolipoyl dehydrogenase [Candidatus Venteria ishoeyi]|uniref:Dihydrolipoyl dehydrogenase n=1 Tax=Candidatus Venteria ishoeyi TaxID=1899563 RepID=A0A1H6FE24_9GAMM|nr:dihydrolipoyl dehydrogenase [Candidatus Venteria ishoeyi]SEH07661.1 Dihydrolipoyl dehydrogenase [Candidatus Venteria ishoeyi]
MSTIVEVRVPDIGDFKDVEIIEIFAQAGDALSLEDSIVTLESDKSAMEIPTPYAGKVEEVLVKLGDQVSQGMPLLTMSIEKQVEAASAAPASAATSATASKQNTDLQADVVVLGAGPGGYTAAFRAADLGKKVVLVERYASLGGVCLNVGCIPSKALLHVAQVVNESQEMAEHGVQFAKPDINLDTLRGWKQKVVKRLTGGLGNLAKQRKVTVVQGEGQFISAKQLRVENESGAQVIGFEHAIIAAGSQATKIPGFPYDDERLMDSTDALELAEVPKNMLVVGGGIIGLEMATVYDALGMGDCKVSIVELSGDLIPGCDRDLVRPLQKRISKRYEAIYLNTRVTAIESQAEGLKVSFEGDKAPESAVYDRVLVAVGRRPNGPRIGAENAGIEVNDMGFIPVDTQMRTNIPHIFAIGDIVDNPMLAHKAVHQAKVAAEVICGHDKVVFDAAIPSVAYTDPEIAWMGVTETEAKAQGIAYEKGSFPWAASGRSLSIGRDEGLTKLLFDRDTKRLIGGGLVGTNAGELLAEVMLAYEMGADVEDIGLTMHAHPTLSETVNLAAEMASGTITDLYAPRRKPW